MGSLPNLLLEIISFSEIPIVIGVVNYSPPVLYRFRKLRYKSVQLLITNELKFALTFLLEVQSAKWNNPVRGGKLPISAVE